MNKDNSIERAKQPNPSAHELVDRLNSLREYYIGNSLNNIFVAMNSNPDLQVVPEVPKAEPEQKAEIIPIFKPPVTPEVRVSNEQLNDIRSNQYTTPVLVTPVNPASDPDYEGLTIKPMSDLDRIRADVDRAIAIGTTTEDPTLAILRPDHFETPDQGNIGSIGKAA